MKRFLVLLVYLITLNSDLFASHPTFINIITNSDTIHHPTLTDVSETEITVDTGIVILIDDVITTGNSVINGIKQLKDAGLSISDVYVIINRLEGASNALELEEVNLYQLTDVLEITTILFQEKLVSKEILDKINNQISQN